VDSPLTFQHKKKKGKTSMGVEVLPFFHRGVYNFYHAIFRRLKTVKSISPREASNLVIGVIMGSILLQGNKRDFNYLKYL
jgi:hypothetical protein